MTKHIKKTLKYRSQQGREYSVECSKGSLRSGLASFWFLWIWEKLGENSRIDILEHPAVKGLWIFFPKRKVLQEIKNAVRRWERSATLHKENVAQL